MSNLVAFDDLGRLGAGDLRSVFREIGLEDAVRALSGAPPALRHLLFSRLGPAFTARIGSIPGPVEPLGLEQSSPSTRRTIWWPEHHPSLRSTGMWA
jgi:hypothetical protein